MGLEELGGALPNRVAPPPVRLWRTEAVRVPVKCLVSVFLCNCLPCLSLSLFLDTLYPTIM